MRLVILKQDAVLVPNRPDVGVIGENYSGPLTKYHLDWMREAVNGRGGDHEDTTKTFPLRAIKDSPPYLHNGRLLT
jgi:hypothetical protein